MQLGLIADIHGNRPALEAVLEDLPQVDQLVCLGDIVGYNPWPADCIEIVRAEADLVLRGNHDRDTNNDKLYHYNETARSALEFTIEQLQESQIQWLWERPDRKEVPDTNFLAAHSHPTKVDEYVMPRDFPRMRPFLDEYDGIFLGHTHIQHRARIDHRLIVNPGSVGQPRDGDPRAAYATYDVSTDELSFHRVEYPIGEVAARISEVGLPEELGNRLYEGK